MAEEGFYTEVVEIFGVSIKQCPEVLCLGLVQFEVSHEANLNGWPLLEDMTDI